MDHLRQPQVWIDKGRPAGKAHIEVGVWWSPDRPTLVEVVLWDGQIPHGIPPALVLTGSDAELYQKRFEQPPTTAPAGPP